MPCDIIIPVFNQKQYTQSCLDSIKKHTRTDYRVIVIDDNSSDTEAVKFLDTIKGDNINVVRNEQNLGWVKSVNRGLKDSRADYICVMNNDTLVTDGWLSEMIKVAEKEPDIGLVNPEWEKPNNIAIDDYARALKKHSGDFIETDWVRGFCFLVKREVIDKIGGLDEAYSPGYFDDWDFSVRAIRAGFRCVLAKAAYVYHYRNVTHRDRFKKNHLNSLMERNKKIFYERWGKPLRIVFAFDSTVANKGEIEKTLSLLAREQHHIYIWAATKGFLSVQHTNAKVVSIAKILFTPFVLINVLNNLQRNSNKHYNIIFIDDKLIFNLFSMLGINKRFKIRLINFNGAFICDEIKKEVDGALLKPPINQTS